MRRSPPSRRPGKRCRRALAGLGVATLVLSCRGATSPPTPAPVWWSYEVKALPGDVLEIEATFEGGIGSPLRVDDDAEPFVDGVSMRDGAALAPFDRGRAHWGTGCGSPCRVHYRVRLGDAATALHDVDVALSAGGWLVAPPSTWLLRPVDAPEGARYRMTVVPAPGSGVVCGVRRAAPGGPYEATVASLDAASFAAFGPLRTVPSPPAGVTVALAPGLAYRDDEIGRWVTASTAAISTYLGRPTPAVTVLVVPGTSEVNRGKTLSGGGPSILMRLSAPPQDLTADWVLAHELVHAGFPVVSPRFAWFGEGLATYVEPIARARAGLVSPERVWTELLEGLPKGEPRAGDAGLDGTHEIDRVYWGGALYFLLADVIIRERTSGRRSLDDAVRAMVASDADATASLDALIAAGDRATGTTVLRELHDRLTRAGAREDTLALLASLGVVKNGSAARLDDAAPRAWLRRAITSPRRE